MNAYGQGYDDSIDVLASEKMIEGIARCRRRVIISFNRLRGAFGKFVGRCFGTRVYGFEREERVCLNSREML